MPVQTGFLDLVKRQGSHHLHPQQSRAAWGWLALGSPDLNLLTNQLVCKDRKVSKVSEHKFSVFQRWFVDIGNPLYGGGITAARSILLLSPASTSCTYHRFVACQDI